jgi:HK97 gp10 family phage protein
MSKNVQGIEEVQANLQKLSDKYGRAVVDAGNKAAMLIRTSAIKSIQSKSSGSEATRYRLGGNSYQHTVSAAGDAPNTDTGALVRSIQIETKPDAIFVGSSIEYSAALEFGTKRMQARPWLIPALESNRKKINDVYGLKIKAVK